MATEKTPNYTPEQTAKVVADYIAGVSVEDIAAGMGKTARSIVAKLSREGVYKKKEYVTKTGAPVVKKDELADKMAAAFGLTEAEADSLTKANKTALAKILAARATLVAEVAKLNAELLEAGQDDSYERGLR